jgi:hypothetical protein
METARNEEGDEFISVPLYAFPNEIAGQPYRDIQAPWLLSKDEAPVFNLAANEDVVRAIVYQWCLFEFEAEMEKAYGHTGILSERSIATIIRRYAFAFVSTWTCYT